MQGKKGTEIPIARVEVEGGLNIAADEGQQTLELTRGF